jgi:hypothetical protein
MAKKRIVETWCGSRVEVQCDDKCAAVLEGWKRSNDQLRTLSESFRKRGDEAVDLLGRANDANDQLRADYNEPRLGCASTGQLLKELLARAEIDGSINYRTIGHD